MNIYMETIASNFLTYCVEWSTQNDTKLTAMK